MNEQEACIAKYISELSVYLMKNTITTEEGSELRFAINILSTQLIMAVGRRTIKESKK